jgi:thiol-disulfide isomerase/thioredoxin
MGKGDEAAGRGAYDQALDAYKKAFSLSNKSSFDAALAMSLAYRGLGDHKKAVDIAGEALKLAGTDPHLLAQAHNVRGRALYALSAKPDDKRMGEAESEFRAALAAEDGFPPARFNLGVALLKQNRDEDGVRELKQYVDQAPAGADVSRAKQMIDDPRRARETFAPPFRFVSRAGDPVALDDYKGKTVLVDFWGSWCPPCVKSTPSLVKLYRKYAEQGVVFLGVAQYHDKPWATYIDQHHIDWPQYLDSSRVLLRQFSITAYPTFIVIDGEGIVRGRRMGWGPETESWLEDEIKKSLKKAP